MLLGGDEIGRSQYGNNNSYCQDSEISWLDWEHADKDLLEFTRRLIGLHKEHPVFRRRRWFQARPIHGEGVRDLGWFKPDGEEMSEEDWQLGFAKSIGVFLNGEAIPSPGPMGERVVDDSFYVLFNAHHEQLPFVLPSREGVDGWAKVLDTSELVPHNESRVLQTARDVARICTITDSHAPCSPPSANRTLSRRDSRG